MFDQVLDFISGRATTPALADDDDLSRAVAALLVEAATMDSDFTAAERATIERLLQDRFDLPPERVRALVAAAEQTISGATQLFPFTREICRSLSPEARSGIIEMLWRVAYADGTLDPDEDALIRHVASLIHVTDRERGLARQRALAKIAAE